MTWRSASSLESPPFDRPRIKTTDDGDPDVGGSVGSDPDVGGSVGSDPDVGGSVGDPAYSWSPPSGMPSDGDVGDSASRECHRVRSIFRQRALARVLASIG
jgi:hypothetical protein